ncbi:glycerate kinase [bacterium (candidate division B38) B3_B38]|nr:MAG: glycerate kinase [bacterium (candidate division B38) B3_B38]
MEPLEKLSRRNVREIFLHSLAAVDPTELAAGSLQLTDELLRVGEKEYDLSQWDSIYVIGVGKASAKMAFALEQVLGEMIKGGLVIIPYQTRMKLKRIEIHIGGHPIPNEAGMQGTQKIVKLLRGLSKRDLVFALISGGGSAMLTLPVAPITLEDKRQLTRLMLECGANIDEINALRKHLSQSKGGRLAKYASPAALVSLILSDVVGDRLDSIASGPTVPDDTTFADCLEIIERYRLRDKVPHRVLHYLQKGFEGKVGETPKRGDPIFENSHHVVIGNNLLALRAAADKAEELGYHPFILSAYIEGEAREVARFHSAIVKEVLGSGNPITAPACLISGGETTVTVKGSGIGGRNLEFVLQFALEIDELLQVTVLSAGTDGIDGNSDAAGALADGETVSKAVHLGMNPQAFLNNNDSYSFFRELGDLIITGPTETNVLDVRIIVVEGKNCR